VNALEQVEVRREWLSYEEARRMVGLSRTTLYRLARSGDIRAAQIGRSVRLSRGSLETYMERQSTANVED
jgi:excisionase family DNA binding protein